jgi:hypothetical protein
LLCQGKLGSLKPINQPDDLALAIAVDKEAIPPASEILGTNPSPWPLHPAGAVACQLKYQPALSKSASVQPGEAITPTPFLGLLGQRLKVIGKYMVNVLLEVISGELSGMDNFSGFAREAMGSAEATQL